MLGHANDRRLGITVSVRSHSFGVGHAILQVVEVDPDSHIAIVSRLLHSVSEGAAGQVNIRSNFLCSLQLIAECGSSG